MEYDNLESIVDTYVRYKLEHAPVTCNYLKSSRIRDFIKDISSEYNPEHYIIDRDMDIFIAVISGLLCNTIRKEYCNDIEHQLRVIYMLLKINLDLDVDRVFPIVKNIITHVGYVYQLYNPELHETFVKTYAFSKDPCDSMYELYMLVNDAYHLENLGPIGISRTFANNLSIEDQYRNLIYNINCGNMLYYNRSKEKARPHVQFLQSFTMQLQRDLGRKVV